jgi:hypothetical protein
LIVETSDDGGVREDEAVVVVVLVSPIAMILGAEAFLEGGNFLLQGVGLRVLEVKRVGGSANTVLSRSGRLEELGFLQELLAALGIGGLQGGSLVLQGLGGGESFISKLGGGRDGRGTGAGGARVGRTHGGASAAT